MKIDFKGKTVLITGATRGIGKAIAECMNNAGANLILTGTRQDEIDQLNYLNREKDINNVTYIQADFSDNDSTKLFLERIEEYPQIDICINNAGVNKINKFEETSQDDFKWINDVNINAPYQILKIVGPKMIKQNYGRIVNIASIWSIVTRPGRSMYTLSKNALVGLTQALAVEWASHNILVNAVSPGFTSTELTKTTNSLEQLEAIKNDIPIKRMANPDEIAKIVTFLCSDLNTYLTGQNIIVDGGYTNV